MAAESPNEPDPGSVTRTASTPVPSAGASQSCANGAEDLVGRLLDALSTGNAEAAAATFSSDDDFEWFSATSSGEHDVVRDHSELDDYFKATFSETEAVELDDMRWNGTRGEVGNFEYDITVTSENGVADWRGKGAVHCEKGVLLVWSMATA